jgi:hypothetical protein
MLLPMTDSTHDEDPSHEAKTGTAYNSLDEKNANYLSEL